ncbi:ABC transporter F family member 4-like [Sebastes umbrosus]|uniref:ABC transporter F family member 4-like n=1 Tax=Sebastes umbrosus TaxID=72105 RepID=UPI00189F3768|nr:ABC transporter F family member 4-like [Sebastes umbrosus]XP_037647611.1 ABC transporter F family member 4-like [Sebastes umbrosus]XP_037647612.1 ABC transporter F family member 4-like [Sebastes umbrosus]
MERKRTRGRIFVDEEEEEKEEEFMDRKSPRKRKRVRYIEDDKDDVEEDEEEEEEEEEEEDQEDNEQPGTSAENTHNQRAQENGFLSVTCGNKKGILHIDKFERGEACIESGDHWFDPPDFEDFGGKASSKKWKQTISHKNKPLQFLFDKGSLTTKGFKRRRSETIKQKKILSRNCITSSSEESEIQSAEETEEDDVKDDNWSPGSEEPAPETEEDEGEKAAAENGGEVVDSGDDESQEGEMEDDDMPAVAENGEDNSVFEERETKSITSTPKKRTSLKKEVKVVIKRLPEATRGCQSNGIKNLLEGLY